MQILNISKLRNGIGILKKQENITENLTAEENRKEITETMENAAGREETCTQTRHERIQQPQRRKQTRQQGKKKKAERLKRKPEQRRKQKVRLQRL